MDILHAKASKVTIVNFSVLDEGGFKITTKFILGLSLVKVKYGSKKLLLPIGNCHLVKATLFEDVILMKVDDDHKIKFYTIDRELNVSVHNSRYVSSSNGVNYYLVDNVMVYEKDKLFIISDISGE